MLFVTNDGNKIVIASNASCNVINVEGLTSSRAEGISRVK